MQTNQKSSVESEKEFKILKEHKSIVFTTTEIQDDFCLILRKSDSHKTFRISAWVLIFINNCTKNKQSGPLITVALVNKKKVYIKCEQEKGASSDRFETIKRD